MSRIELSDLGPQSLDALERFRKVWTAHRASTAAADRSAAERGVECVYAAASLSPPRHVVWCGSPVGIWKARQAGDRGRAPGLNVKSSVVDAVFATVTRQVEAAIGKSARARIWNEWRAALPAPISRGVNEAIGTATRTGPLDSLLLMRLAFRMALKRMVYKRRAEEAEPAFVDAGIGQHDLPLLGLYQFLHDELGLDKETAALNGLWTVATSAGWMAPYENVCWLAERHSVLKADPLGRLHEPHGPALAYPDGWCHYAWKGVKMPAGVIERPETVTVGMIAREHDPVMRRCLIELITPARFISESDAVPIAEDETGILWLKTWHHWDSWAAVEVVNGTPEPDGSLKHYFLQVPPTMRSAREAVAWTYGISKREYKTLRMRT